MAKLTKDELIEKYSSMFEENSEEKIAFLEDVSDSIEPADNSDEIKAKDAEIERLKSDNEALRTKYIQRFMGDVSEETKKIDEDKSEDLEEKEVIDIKEI
jgi:hypothetical protein